MGLFDKRLKPAFWVGVEITAYLVVPATTFSLLLYGLATSIEKLINIIVAIGTAGSFGLVAYIHIKNKENEQSLFYLKECQSISEKIISMTKSQFGDPIENRSLSIRMVSGLVEEIINLDEKITNPDHRRIMTIRTNEARFAVGAMVRDTPAEAYTGVNLKGFTLAQYFQHWDKCSKEAFLHVVWFGKGELMNLYFPFSRGAQLRECIVLLYFIVQHPRPLN